MKTLKNWCVTHADSHHVALTVDDKHTLCIYVLEAGLFRVAVKREGAFSLDRTWSIAPESDVPWEGRPRESLAGFTLPAFTLGEQDDRLTLSTDVLRVVVQRPLALEWHYRDREGHWQLLARDRPTSAYQLNAHGDGVAHYQQRGPDDRYFGLGEKTGDLQRNGRRYEMRNLDAMGYDASSTDPLYKHVPFTLTRRSDISFGLFYDNLSSSWFDLGNEMDNYHQP